MALASRQISSKEILTIIIASRPIFCNGDSFSPLCLHVARARALWSRPRSDMNLLLNADNPERSDRRSFVAFSHSRVQTANSAMQQTWLVCWSKQSNLKLPNLRPQKWWNKLHNEDRYHEYRTGWALKNNDTLYARIPIASSWNTIRWLAYHFISLLLN